MKRLFAFFLALVLLIGAVPVAPVHATEAEEPTVTEPEVTETTEPEVTEPEVTEPEVTEPEVTEPEVTEPEITVTRETIVPDVDLPGNDDLFAGYAQQVFYGEAATFGTAAGARLTGNEKILYDALVPIIKQIAAGDRTSTVIGIGQEQSYDGETYASDADATFVVGEIDTYQLVSALLTDLPYELYWYDKTAGTPSMLFGGDTPVYIQLSFPVAANYAAGTYAVDTAIAGAAETSAAKAQDIVTANAAKSDYEKLVAYKAAICDLVSYENNFGNFSTDNDPWQLIHVFDGDSSTNVVCEGYSKAFMYLCDQSDFSQNITCVTVSGDMGGPHMWNIVEIGGSSYLVDVTNSESGTVGQSGNLFLAGGTGSAASGYTVGGYSYTYDTDTTDLWGTDADSILTLAADNYSPNAGGNEGGSEEPTPCQHTYGEWTVVTPATCNIVGTQQRTCADCGEVESQEIPLADHTYENGTCTVCGAVQPTSTADGFTYTVADGAVTITGYTGTETALVIPATIEGLPVTTIGEHAFQGSEKLVSVTIPDSVTTIGRLAFGACFALTDITIPEGVTTIGMGAFDVCTSLESITLPASVTTLGEEIFFGCSNLTTMILPATFPGFSYGMLTDCYNLWHILYKGTEAQWAAVAVAENNSCLATATVHCLATGNEVTDADAVDCTGKIVRQCTVCGAKGYDNDYTGPLGEHAYGDWTVVTPATCDTPGSEQRVCGVCNSSELRNTDLADHTYDENGTCTVCGYAPIPLPEGLIYSKYSDGIEITGYTGTEAELILPNEIDGLPVIRIGSDVFKNNTTLTHISLPDSLDSIGSGAFWGCKNLKEVVFPEGLRSIQGNTFKYCTSLTSVFLPDSVTYLGAGTFQGCKKLELAVLGKGIGTLHSYTFAGCSSLRCIAFTSSLTEIQSWVFDECNALECCVYLGTESQLGRLKVYDSYNDPLFEVPVYLEGACCPPVAKATTDGVTGKPKLSWGKEPCAIGYAIFRCATEDGEYDYVDITLETSFVDTTAKGGKYYYIVVGISPYGELGFDSNVVSASVKCAAPTLVGSNKASSGKPVISWEAVEGASKYDVYRATSKTGKYTKVKTTTATSYTDTDASAGKTYYYKVKTIASSSSNNSGYSAVLAQLCICAQPATTLTTASATGKPVISWKKVSGASKYEVYRSFTQDGEFELLATTAELTYTDKTAPVDADCWYKVNALASNSACNSIDAEPKLIRSSIARPGVSAKSDAATGKPVISWGAVEGAVSYKITRATKSSGTYYELDTTTELTYTDTAASRGKTYYYKVTAIGENCTGAASSYASCACRNAAPVITVTPKASTGKPVVKWEKVSGGKKYEVYRSASETGKYTLVKTTTSTSYTDTKATAGKTYFYKVRALASSSTYKSAYSTIVPCLTICAQPSVKLAVAATGKPVISWGKVSGASSYEIYRSNTQDGTYELVTATASLSYTDTAVAVDTDYWYKVNAIAANTDCNSIDAAPKLIHTTIARPALSTKSDAATGKPVLSWDAVDGAVSYKVYRATKKSGKYKAVATVTEPTYTDTAASRGKTYYYKVRAYGENCSSVYSSIKSCASRNAAPVLTAAVKTSTGKPVISWKKVSGTKKYEVYRSTSENGTYTKVKTTTSTSYTDTKAAVGTTYYYKVRSVASSKTYTGAFSTAVPCLCVCGRPSVKVSVNSTYGKPYLSWGAVSGAQSYVIYRMDAQGNEIQLAEITATSYRDDAAAPDTDYSYKVNALGADAALHSADGSYQLVHATVAQPAVTAKSDAATGKPVLTWDAVDGAVSYKVYRATKKSGTYKAVATVTDPTYTDTAASRGKTYYYKVRAYGANCSSVYSSIKSCASRNAQPVVTVTAGSTGNPVLTWGKVSGTKKYEVYRSTSPDSGFTRVKSTTSLKFTDSAPAEGITYYYKVRSVASSSSYTGAYSQVAVFPLPQ